MLILLKTTSRVTQMLDRVLAAKNIIHKLAGDPT